MNAPPETRVARPVPAVLAVLVEANHVLLARRANAPDAGKWGFPGGRIEPGEPAVEAVRRELREETGLQARIGGVLDVVDVITREHGVSHHFVLLAYACTRPVGTPRAGDDAVELGWFDLGAIAGLPSDQRSDGVLALAHRALSLDLANRSDGRTA